MPVSKKISAVTAAAFVAVSGLFAQSAFPSVSSPSMPTISSPSIGSGFYIPSYPQQNTETKVKADNRNSGKESTENNSKTEEKKKRIASSITANEISTLGSMGLLGNLYTTQTTSETKEILEKVLSEIEEIKENTKDIPEKAPVTIVASAPVVSSNTLSSAAEKAASRILRFNVNDYDILKTCGKIYISDIQHDGSFLVTGDRRYMSDGKQRKETFHMLFKNSRDVHGVVNYNAATAVTQDYLNEYSFLYQLSKKPDMSAMRTGNLVTMRTTDPDWKMELLIDLGEK